MEKFTRIRVKGIKGGSHGLLDWGERTHQEMVKLIRDDAQRRLEIAKTILETKTEDFEVAIVRGPIVQHFVKEVLPTESEANQ